MWRDNIFVKRLCRTIQYEKVYLRADDSVAATTASLDRYLTPDNTRGPHSSLADQAPR